VDQREALEEDRPRSEWARRDYRTGADASPVPLQHAMHSVNHITGCSHVPPTVPSDKPGRFLSWAELEPCKLCSRFLFCRVSDAPQISENWMQGVLTRVYPSSG
jgi:hypothetical protein